MNAYLKWNDAIASYFFNSEVADRSVYLNVSQGLISEIGQNLAPGTLEFVSSVKRGPPWTYSQGLCQRALDAHWDWRRRGLEFPPYVGYLALFVLAAGADGDFHPNAYYPRLRQLLGESGEGMYPSFHYMWQLWDDLQEWATIDKHGELGNFESRTIGGHRHIGYPISQSILSEQDRLALPRVFFNSGLDPASIHSHSELAMALRTIFARNHLIPRTIRLAENPDDTLHSTLLDSVAEELANWDGTVAGPAPSPGTSRRVFGGLRLCLELNTVTGVARAYLRCKLNHEYPETGLILRGGLQAEEDVNGWSLPITSESTGEIFDASQLNWQSGLTLRATSHDYEMRLPGHGVRVFTSGIGEGIRDLVETHVIPRGQPFYLCYPGHSWPLLERWATTQCQGFKEIDVDHGLPRTWRLASIEMALNDEAARHSFPVLSFAQGTRLRLMGGIRSGPGNNFFSFAPPQVALTGAEPGTEVRYGEELLSRVAGGDFYELPSGIPVDSRVTIEVRSGQNVLKRSLFLTGDFSLPLGEPALLLNAAGSVAESSENVPMVAGAYIKNPPPWLPSSAAELFRDLEYQIGGIRGFLIGQRPGEIVEWPSESFPETWLPVWVINKHGRKKWEVLFVGQTLGSGPCLEPVATTPRKKRDWKHAVWHLRKRIAPPALSSERALWRHLQEAAHDV